MKRKKRFALGLVARFLYLSFFLVWFAGFMIAFDLEKREEMEEIKRQLREEYGTKEEDNSSDYWNSTDYWEDIREIERVLTLGTEKEAKKQEQNE